jgi:hypothetical protein
VFLTGVTFRLGVNLLSGHFYAEFLAKQEYGAQPMPGEILSKMKINDVRIFKPHKKLRMSRPRSRNGPQ